MSESFRKVMNNTWKARHQGTAGNSHMGTEYVLRKIVMSKYKTFSTGNNSTCTVSCTVTIKWL